jgi:hypothetical protein
MPYSLLMMTSTEIATFLANTPAGTRVRVSLQGRGYWRGTLVKSDERGADLRGTRGAPLHFVRNVHSGNFVAVTNQATSHRIERIELR